MSDVTVEIQIAAPIEVVWARALDPHSMADWVTIHRSFTHIDEGSLQVGFKMGQVLTLRGAPFKVNWTLAECTEPTHARWRGKGPARSHADTEYRLTARDGGTHFAYYNAFEPPLGLIGRVAQRALAGHTPQVEGERSLERLRVLCETAGNDR